MNETRKSRFIDSPHGVKDFLSENQIIDEYFIPSWRDVYFIPDPQIAFVWLVIDQEKKNAFIVYLLDEDFEDVSYEDAIRELKKAKHRPGYLLHMCDFKFEIS